jgi:isoquinoline 1-oxidoreductase beta subunit
VAVEPAPISPLYANELLAEEASEGSAFPSAFGIDRWAARRYAAREALMITAGSTSVRAFEPRLREAGAAARALLSKAAARRWQADWEELDTRAGFVWRGGDRIPFAELAEAAADEELPENLPVRGGIEHRLAGQPLPRLDVPAKIDGSAMFAADVRLPDMVFAAVRSAPDGSRRVAMDRAEADAVPGALSVVEHRNWTAAIGTNWWAAARALDALRPRWEVPVGGPSAAAIRASLVDAVESGEGESVYESGDLGGPFPGASPVSARYYVAPAPSAPVEPLAATARLIGDRLEVWAPTQAPGLARAAAARAAGMAEAQVTLYPMPVGGGYGRKLETEAVEQAAVLAVQLERPVQLSWPRIQEIQRDTPRPPAAGRLTAWIGQNGIAAWRARIAAPGTAAEVAARLDAAAGFFRPDGGAAAGAVPPYEIPNVAVDHVPVGVGIRTGVWRGGAHSYTCFFTECFLDELSRLAGMEPLSFRMGMLPQSPRLARALATATSIGGWDGGQPGSGMGIAAHSAFGSHVATLVEVEITREQRLRVLRAVCAVDCGRIVNPEIVRQQIEGGIVHGISAATGAPLEYENGVPAARTIGAYRLPVLRDSPEVTVELLESEEEPGGVTELAVPTAAPAVANALFSLTGVRLRALPLTIGG